MGFISIRVADFYAGSPNLTQPSTFSHRGLGAGNGSVKLTQNSSNKMTILFLLLKFMLSNGHESLNYIIFIQIGPN
jgi:hypothetical protein